ncbi:MAG: SDR family oxidoreductase [Trueperaceae bacterium]
MKLTGHKVLITGGSSGIGLALAKALVAKGNQVLICGRDNARLKKAVQEVPGLEAAVCDVAQVGSLPTLLSTAQNKIGGLSILVNNAAIQLNDDFQKTDTQTLVQGIDQELDINLRSVLQLSTLSLELLRQHDEAVILTLTSGLALWPKKSAPVYCATKAALHAFCQSLRYQLLDTNSKTRIVEAILPIVDTPMTQGRGKERLKMSPEKVTREILRGLENSQTELHVGGVKLFMLLERLFPGLPKRILRNS